MHIGNIGSLALADFKSKRTIQLTYQTSPRSVSNRAGDLKMKKCFGWLSPGHTFTLENSFDRNRLPTPPRLPGKLLLPVQEASPMLRSMEPFPSPKAMVCDLLMTPLFSCAGITSPPSLHTLVRKNNLSPIGHPFNPWAESSDLKNQTQDLFLFQYPRKWRAHLVEGSVQ